MGVAFDNKALENLHQGGGVLYPFQHGYEPLGTLLDQLPKQAWRRDEHALGALVLYLVKQGQTARAKSYLTAESLEFRKTYIFDLLELLLALHMGETVNERKWTTWRRLERHLPLSNPLLLGLYYNSILAMSVRLGRPDQARIAAQQAISCYREDDCLYLEFYIHVHLADLDVVEGRLHRAEQGLRMAEKCLTQAGRKYANEEEIIEIVRLAISYERGDFEHVVANAPRLRHSLVSGDSWSELFFQLARISVLSRYFVEGREAAQDELEAFQADYVRRHGGTATAIEILAAWIWHLEWHPEEAERILKAVSEHSGQSTLATTLLTELKGAMHQNVPTRSNSPRGELLSFILSAQNSPTKQRRGAIEESLKRAMHERHIAPFLENRDIFLGVSTKLSRTPLARRNRKYAYLANLITRKVEQSYVVPEKLMSLGLNRRQYRVVSALQTGATNKQIARQLGITEATVKYHLTSIYRLTKISNRYELIDFMNNFDDFSYF